MRTLIVAASGIVLLLGASSAAQASILGGLLNFDGTENVINDNSATKIFDSETDEDDPGFGFISDGDKFVGLLEFEKVNTDDPSPGAIFAVVAFEIGSFNLDGTANLVPIINSDALSLKSLLDPALQPAGYTDAQWDKTLAVIVEIDDISVGAGTDDAVNPYDPAHTESDIDIIADAVTAANGWSYVATLGLETGSNAHGSTDFFKAQPLIDLTTTSIAALEGDDSGLAVLRQRGGFTILDNTFGSSIVFLPTGVRTTFTIGALDSFHDIVLRPDGTVQTSTGSLHDQGWSFEDDANFRLSAVPEPATITVWAGIFGGAAGLGLIRRRRRKTTAKQSSAA